MRRTIPTILCCGWVAVIAIVQGCAQQQAMTQPSAATEPAHQPTAGEALITARKNAATAHAAVSLAEKNLKLLQKQVNDEIEAEPMVADARRTVEELTGELEQCNAAMEDEKALALKLLRQSLVYREAQESAADALAEADKTKADPNATANERAIAVTYIARTKARLAELENEATPLDPSLMQQSMQTKKMLVRYTDQLESLRQTFLHHIRKIQAAKDALADAQAAATAADQALVEAEATVAKEVK